MARANRIKPRKLHNSKWTAVDPAGKEKHFLVKDIAFDEDGAVRHCLIEAVIYRRSQRIDRRQLKNRAHWLQGWQ